MKLRATLLGTLLLVSTGISHDSTIEMTKVSHAKPKISCSSWLVPETDQGWYFSRLLIRHGWRGIPGDGSERLYSPRCLRHMGY